MKVLFLMIGSAFLTTIGFAGTICPISTAPTPFAHDPDAALTGCNTLITINPNLSVTTVVRDASPYDGVEDTLVGVLNLSSIAISSLTLTGANIFSLDGDGICTFTFVGSGYCSAAQKSGVDPGDYYGPTSTFTITTANSGAVSFGPNILAGGSSYFSLEDPPTANLSVVVSPEPASMFLLGTGFVGLMGFRVWRKRDRTTL